MRRGGADRGRTEGGTAWRRWSATAALIVLVGGCASPPSMPTSDAVASPAGSPLSTSVATADPNGPIAGEEDLGSVGLGEHVDGTPAYLEGPTGSVVATVDVAEPGGRLRVSLDLSKRDDCVSFQLIRPDGVPAAPSDLDYPYVCPSAGRSGQSFDIEQSVVDAAVGRWQVIVDGADVRYLALRLRVTMDPAATPAVIGEPLLPDLIPWLPWEFGFAAPASANPGTADDRENRPGRSDGLLPPGGGARSDAMPPVLSRDPQHRRRTDVRRVPGRHRVPARVRH